MEKKYRLLKDLPGVEAGTVFTEARTEDKPEHARESTVYSPPGLWVPAFIKSEMKPPWFEEIKKPKKEYTKEDMDSYALWCCVNLGKEHSFEPTIKDWLKYKNK